MNTRLAFLTGGIYLFLALVIGLFNFLTKKTVITASIGPRRVVINEPVIFRDSTKNAKTVVWEFGNGDKSRLTEGVYKYKKEGIYLVRLTVNSTVRDTFSIVVSKPSSTFKASNSLFILANNTGIVGQKIHFRVAGPKIEWCEWYFGETGKIDSRDLETFYSFPSTGDYIVKLITNLNPKEPLTHRVTITTPFKALDNMPEEKPEEKPAAPEIDKLMQSLQVIADGGNVSTNYNMILKSFLCSNQQVKVIVNGKNPIDFYSYCQSLQLGNDIKLLEVVQEKDPRNCPQKLIIKQH